MQILVIIAVYTILYIYSISQINHWLKTISKRLLPRFIADTILIVLGLMPVGAAFIGKGSLRNALETNGNLWFGYLVYLTGFLLVFNVLRRRIGPRGIYAIVAPSVQRGSLRNRITAAAASQIT